MNDDATNRDYGHGGARPGAGRPARGEPKARPIWCGQMSPEQRDLILNTLTPRERYGALMYFVERAINEPAFSR